MKPFLFLIVLVPIQLDWCPEVHADSSQQKLSIETREDRVIIRFGDLEFAHYVFRDVMIPRPYFAHVKTPGGKQATRSHPPVEGREATDHATMHPGIWLAFGDLDGQDYWRNKASIEHVKYIEAPRVDDNSATFIEEKLYVAASGQEVCRELFRWKLHALQGGFLMEWNSAFTSDREFYFGDQEEMGLGVRVTTPLAEKNGGMLHDSEGRKSAKRIWSNAARWCDYHGTIGDHVIGMTILCHPDNFRPSWMHARNYGFMAANPFGRKAMNKGKESKVIVKPGESLRLRYGIWIHTSQHDANVDIEAVYRKYIQFDD